MGEVEGGGFEEVAEDHFDGAVLGIEAGGEVGGVNGKWVHGRQVG